MSQFLSEIQEKYTKIAKIVKTRMHSSRMHSTRSLIISLYLVVSHTHPRSNHARPPEQPRIPLGATMHAPRSNHACPHPRSNHALPGSNYACPPGATTPPGATRHAPPSNQACPSLVNRMTNRCKNITLPQTGGNKHFRVTLLTDWSFLPF